MQQSKVDVNERMNGIEVAIVLFFNLEFTQ
jgi:hypothetical protein